MLAVVSDIHSNIEALTEVMNDIRNQGCREILCLGDVIGYGPNPRETLSIAMEHFGFTLLGNHEWAVLNEPFGFNAAARGAVNWTREQLVDFSHNGQRAWDFLEALPNRVERGKFLFVHGSPSNPVEEYLLRSDVDELLNQLSPKLERAFNQMRWVTFVGHTHYPGAITDNGQFLTPQDLDFTYELRESERVIINVGSVGQPRDRDTRACYATIDRGVIRWHRIAYDVEKTFNKVLEAEKLDHSLGERLLVGV